MLLTDEAKMNSEQKEHWKTRCEVRRKLQEKAPMANPYADGVLASDPYVPSQNEPSEIDKALGLDALDDLLEEQSTF